MVFILLLVLPIFIFFLLPLLLVLFCDPIYCMDSFIEAQNELLHRISRVEGNIEYFSDQAKQTDELFKQAIRENLPEDMRKERLNAKRESETNLNIERKVLRILKSRLDSGDLNPSISTSSSLGKRGFDQSEQ
jgi:uncharacterized protein YdcH (DUF465 family)